MAKKQTWRDLFRLLIFRGANDEFMDQLAREVLYRFPRATEEQMQAAVRKLDQWLGEDDRPFRPRYLLLMLQTIIHATPPPDCEWCLNGWIYPDPPNDGLLPCICKRGEFEGLLRYGEDEYLALIPRATAVIEAWKAEGRVKCSEKERRT